VSHRDLYVYALPVDADGNEIMTTMAAGPTVEPRFGQAWPLRLSVPITWSADAFVGNSIGGRSIPTFGALRVHNDDGALDGWMTRAWDGRSLSILAPSPEAEVLDEFLAMLTTEQPTWDAQAITIPIRDASALYDVPAQLTQYAGTGEYEGNAELTGGVKPLLLGYARYFEPVLLSAEQRIYQLHDGPISPTGFFVFERGRVFDVVNAVSDVATWVTAGHEGEIAVDYDHGLIRLASAPAGLIVCHARANDLPTYDGLTASHANLARRMLARHGYGVSTASMTAMNAASPTEPVGTYLREPTTLAAVLDAIATSCGALWSVDPVLGFSMRQIGWSASVGTITPTEISAGPVRETTDVPAWRVAILSSRTHRVHTATDFGAAVVIPAVRQELSREYDRYAVAEDAVRTRHPLARDVEIPSIFNHGAYVEGQRQAALLRHDRDRYTVTVWGAHGRYHLGDTVTLQYSRCGLDAGKDFLVLGLDESVTLDTDTDTTVLRLWGPKQADE
jgi:hypothetical protein